MFIVGGVFVGYIGIAAIIQRYNDFRPCDSVPALTLGWLQVLCEAFGFVSAATPEDLPPPKALQKLLDALERQEGRLRFTAAQQRHAAVWRLAIIMPQQLATDDSFMFSKAAKNVRELVEGLPEVGDGENDALAHILVRPTNECGWL